ncbi:MAG: hypothetical protein DRG20_00410 [Deltaproteobacteria bacterium]|nr:MAG: hypothetical protein DRG20_00410 [Deltaproteobacteria bacterium]
MGKKEETPPLNGTTDFYILPEDIPRLKLRRVFPTLILMQGAEIGRDYPLRKKDIQIIGRSIDADISIAGDPLVSRVHSKITVIFDPLTKTKSYFIEDLGSKNKTFVNFKPIKKMELKEGDMIQVGNTVLKFVMLDEVDAKFHKEIQKKIQFDDLTSLLTLESFKLALEKELYRCKQYKLPLSFFMMDLDFFKKVNDTYGHSVGSAVLRDIGNIINKNLRDIDVSGRYGGEEFVAYLREIRKDVAFKVAERIRKRIEKHEFKHEGYLLHITISIGISQFPDDGRNYKELLKNADKALYIAKEKGRNRVVLFNS